MNVTLNQDGFATNNNNNNDNNHNKNNTQQTTTWHHSILELTLKPWFAVATLKYGYQLGMRWIFSGPSTTMTPLSTPPISPFSHRIWTTWDSVMLPMSHSLAYISESLSYCSPQLSAWHKYTLSLWAKVSLLLRSGCVCGGVTNIMQSKHTL